MELRCEGDSRGTLFRVRFGFTRTPASPPAAAALLLLAAAAAAAAALFLRGLAIATVEREMERDRRRRERWVAHYGDPWRWLL